jgi:flagellar biosynthetic protein FliR
MPVPEPALPGTVLAGLGFPGLALLDPLAGTAPLDPFAVLLVFIRVGMTMAILPGFSAAYVPMQIRLILALVLTVLVTPVLAPALPGAPEQPIELVLLLAGESVIGAFLGTLTRILVSALHVAGTMISYYASLTNGLVQDPVVEQQSATVAGFFVLLGLVLIFAADLHHPMLRGIVDSYALFAPGVVPPADEFAEAVGRTVAESFLLGMEISAPFLIVGLAYQVGLGLLGRLMPQLQVFFFGLPAQIGLQVWVAVLTLSGVMMVFLDRFAPVARAFSAG